MAYGLLALHAHRYNFWLKGKLSRWAMFSHSVGISLVSSDQKTVCWGTMAIAVTGELYILWFARRFVSESGKPHLAHTLVFPNCAFTAPARPSLHTPSLKKSLPLGIMHDSMVSES